MMTTQRRIHYCGLATYLGCNGFDSVRSNHRRQPRLIMQRHNGRLVRTERNAIPSQGVTDTSLATSAIVSNAQRAFTRILDFEPVFILQRRNTFHAKDYSILV